MLSDLQCKFKEAILTGRDRGLEWISAKPPISRAARLHIYSYAYFARLAENLEDDFAHLAAAIGPKAFEKLANEFFRKQPPTCANANETNRCFPDFFSAHALAKKHPALRDLVRFEWALVEAFYAPAMPRRGAENLASASRDDWSEVRLVLDPSVQLVVSDWNIVSLVKRRGLPCRRRTTRLIAYQRDDQAYWRELSAAQFTLLQRFSQRMPLAQATEGLAAGQFDSKLFADWWGDGIIRSLDWPSSRADS